MKMKEYLLRFLNGIIMGLANIIPGVSGGTMALLMGIYERLIYSINSIPIKETPSLIRGEGKTFLQELKEIDYAFLLPLIAGIAAATLVLARFIEMFLDQYTAMTFSFFFGLILASAGTLYERIDKFDWKILISGTAGFLFAFFLAGLSPLKANHSPIVIFFSGAVSIVSMILPGISGSFILVFLHQYEYMINALNSLDMLDIIVFMSGAVVGLFSFAKGVEILFKKYKAMTLVFLFGLILGALRVPVIRGFSADPTFLEWVIPATIGSLFVTKLNLLYHLKKE